MFCWVFVDKKRKCLGEHRRKVTTRSIMRFWECQRTLHRMIWRKLIEKPPSKTILTKVVTQKRCVFFYFLNLFLLLLIFDGSARWIVYLVVLGNWVFLDCVFGLVLLGQLVQICSHSRFLFDNFIEFGFLLWYVCVMYFLVLILRSINSFGSLWICGDWIVNCVLFVCWASYGQLWVVNIGISLCVCGAFALNWGQALKNIE